MFENNLRTVVFRQSLALRVKSVYGLFIPAIILLDFFSKIQNPVGKTMFVILDLTLFIIFLRTLFIRMRKKLKIEQAGLVLKFGKGPIFYKWSDIQAVHRKDNWRIFLELHDGSFVDLENSWNADRSKIINSISLHYQIATNSSIVIVGTEPENIKNSGRWLILALTAVLLPIILLILIVILTSPRHDQGLRHTPSEAGYAAGRSPIRS